MLLHAHCFYYCSDCFSNNLNQNSTSLLPHKTPFLQSIDSKFFCNFSSGKTKRAYLLYMGNGYGNGNGDVSRFTKTQATFVETPVVLWAGRICLYYALLKAGLAGSPSSPLISSDTETGGDDMGFSKWFARFQGNPDKEASDKRKLVSKWYPTTKGTLKRNYRVRSKSEGQRLLRAVASLLSDDDHFRDATSHKGCQIRRQSAHGESVCCNNVRALFDELPTLHLTIEISPFPSSPLTENDYLKAEELERVLRSGPSI